MREVFAPSPRVGSVTTQGLLYTSEKTPLAKEGEQEMY